MASANIDSYNCDHEFEFEECFGTFCKKCDIGYGVECLHPECKIHSCDKHNLSYPSIDNENTFSTVAEDMTDNIYHLHLGHDGVIDGEIKDIHKVLSFPGLNIVEYCGYYTSKNVTDMFESGKYSRITFTPII